MTSVDRTSSPSLSTSLSLLQRDVLKTLLYFDIFDHPLNSEEIYRFLPSNSTNAAAIEVACQNLPLVDLLKNEGGFFSLKTNPFSSLVIRQRKEARAKDLMRIAQLMARLIKRMPFVRAVAISGELSKGVAGDKSDIDFFIITARDRLWICRTLLIILKKVFFLNSRKFLCLNHFISEERLPFEEKSVYTAIEIATLKALSNERLVNEYRSENSWVNEYLPNVEALESHLIDRTELPSALQKLIERVLPPFLLDRIDLWLMKFWRKIWKQRYPDLSDEKRNELFRSTRFMSTAYGGDFFAKVANAYRERLTSYTLQ